MGTIIFAFSIVLLSMGGLALGVMAGRKPIKGSCGGLACLKGVDCSVCPNKSAPGESS
ncbi:MAG: (Na+)-NQR maturation NqrM [Hyphomicrobiales bacterium]